AYDLNSVSPGQPITLQAPPYSGRGVSVFGRRIAVASQPGYWVGEGPVPTPPPVQALVHDLTGATDVITTLSNPHLPTPDGFGYSVAISPNRLVVGAPNDDTVNLDAGAVYLYGSHLGPPSAQLQVFSPVGAPLSNGSSQVY